MAAAGNQLVCVLFYLEKINFPLQAIQYFQSFQGQFCYIFEDLLAKYGRHKE